jgi:hypothetical protein
MNKVDFIRELRKTLGYEPGLKLWDMIKVVYYTDESLGIETTPRRILNLFPELAKEYEEKGGKK